MAGLGDTAWRHLLGFGGITGGPDLERRHGTICLGLVVSLVAGLGDVASRYLLAPHFLFH